MLEDTEDAASIKSIIKQTSQWKTRKDATEERRRPKRRKKRKKKRQKRRRRVHLEILEGSMTAVQGRHVGSPCLVHTEAVPVHPPPLHIYCQMGSVCHSIHYYPSLTTCR